MNSAFVDKNWKDLHDLAHKLKSSFRLFGAIDLGFKMERIELLTEEHGSNDIDLELDEVSNLLAIIVNESESVYKELKEELQIACN